MMQIVKRTMNWLPRQSTYSYVQQQNAKRKAAHQAFIDSQSSLSSTFSTIFSNLSQGQSTNAAQAALARVTASKGSSADAIQQALDQIAATKDQLSSASDTSSDTSSTADPSVDILA
jgi:hypothetical protein